ncbi:hypothetical protein ICM05_08520 [Leucobacter sp. cx-42]|uniref:hypothetical protein n=1 Tax=unclassified Leucobacter TaxID=2621730 RepID=UPI00165D7F65|nr:MULTISPECIES: hypothetical protein [unclassified Leucobacter]MBC9954688.1 hypothetical protein [Leucobacter sp. cx-42]
MKTLRAVLIAFGTLVLITATAFVTVIIVKGGVPTPTTVTESRSSQVVMSVQREDQVVLMSLGIQGLEQTDSHGEIWGLSVPGSGKKAFLPYSFTAKLGIDGGKVRISEVDENEYHIAIPKFIFVGNGDVQFDDMLEVGGILSGTAGEINQSEMTNRILSAENEDAYVAKNLDILKSQARTFYTNIVMSVDPTAKVEFSFE